MEVNGEQGFWLSFNIEADQYWLRLEPDRIQDETGFANFGLGLRDFDIDLDWCNFYFKINQ